MVPVQDLHKIVMVTSDERVAELIEHVAKVNPNVAKYPAFDLVVSPLATGSKEYIEWVKVQTMKKDPNAAFFNEIPLVGNVTISSVAPSDATGV